MKKISALILVLFTSCAVPFAQPTITPSPTATFTITNSPTNTFTATKTNTATFTPTGTPTPTETPQPPSTLTAVSKNSTASIISSNATSTASAISGKKTATVKARAATATEIAKYKPIDWRELVNYSDNHKGEFIKIRGRVFNIVGANEFQMFVGNYEGVYVVTKGKLSGLYEDMWVWVYGVVGDTYCFKNAFDSTVCQSLIEKAFWSVNPY